MPDVHVCTLPRRDTSGLPRLAPNTSCWKRLVRKLRKLIIVNPNHSKCHYISYNKSDILTEQRRHINSRYSYIIHPFSTLSTVQGIMFFLLWTERLINEPMFNNMIMADPVIDETVDIVAVVLQYIIIISFFFLGYVDMKTREVVIEHKQVIRRYLRTYFLSDLMSTKIPHLIFMWPLYTYIENEEFYSYLYNALKFIHIPFLYIRLNTLLNYLNDIGKLMKMKRVARRIIIHILRTFMYLHYFTCMIYLLPRAIYVNYVPSNSWLEHAKISPNYNATFARIYGETLLTTICNFLGTGERYPVEQTNEQILFFIISIFGRLYTIFLLAEVLRTFGITELSQSNYDRELSQMKEYMRANDFPLAMRSKMIRYLEYRFKKRYFDEHEILNNLSGNLKSQIFLYFASKIVSKCNIFKHMPSADIAVFFSLMKMETFTPGDFIYKYGQLVDYVYFISSGTVAVFNNNDIEMRHLEDGDVFGICTVIGREAYSVLVLEVTDVLVIKIDMFYEFLKEYPDAMHYLREMAKERYDVYEREEKIIKREKSGCLDDLRNGRLLEKRRMLKRV